MNLRGLRESSNLFAVPTYLFVASFAGMLAYGFVRWAAGWETSAAPDRRARDGPRTSRSSWCCAPSPPAARRSPAWRRCPTGCPPSGRRRRATPAPSSPGSAIILITLFVGHHVPGPAPSRDAARGGDGRLAARPAHLRRRAPVLRDPGRHHADPDLRGQHRLRRLPAPGLLPGPRRLHPPPVRHPRRSARLLQRDPDPGRARRAPHRAVRRRHPRPHPALRGRRVPLLHALAGEHGAALAHAARAGLAVALGPQRGGSGHHRTRDAGHRDHQVQSRGLDDRAADPPAGGAAS